MTPELRYTLEGRPVGFKRTEGGKDGARYTERAMRAAKAAHRLAALAVRPRGWSLTGAFTIEVTAYEHPMQRGDSDNYGKLAKDALQTVAYRNDRSVFRDVFERLTDRERPRVEVCVRRVDAAEPRPRRSRPSAAKPSASTKAGPALQVAQPVKGYTREQIIALVQRSSPTLVAAMQARESRDRVGSQGYPGGAGCASSTPRREDAQDETGVQE